MLLWLVIHSGPDDSSLRGLSRVGMSQTLPHQHELPFSSEMKSYRFWLAYKILNHYKIPLHIRYRSY